MSVVSGSRLRETIHSGHFMVSDFEPESEAQDEEYEVGMPIPPGGDDTVVVNSNGRQATTTAATTPFGSEPIASTASIVQQEEFMDFPSFGRNFLAQNFGESFVTRQPQFQQPQQSQQQPLQQFQQQQLQLTQKNSWISIDSSLTKLFQCMSLAYSIQTKTYISEMEQIQGSQTSLEGQNKAEQCDLEMLAHAVHIKEENAVVMEGKYWKRKLSTVAAEYKKWRLFYRNRIMGWTHNNPTPDLHPVSLDGFDWNRPGTFGGGPANVMFDDDLLMDFTDILFSSLSSNQPFAFPNPREIARAGMVADFIQPGLIQLQPNLEDFMDTLEPLQDYVNSKLLPPVPEELESFDPPDSILPDVLPSMMSKVTNASNVVKSETTTQAAASTSAAGNAAAVSETSVISSIRSVGNSSDISRQMGASSFTTGSLQQDPSAVTSNQPSFYQIPTINDRSGNTGACSNKVSSVIQQTQSQATTSTSSVAALLQDNTQQHQRSPQHQSSASGATSRSSFNASRNDVFAKPVGKPRSGRSRGGSSSRSGSLGQLSTPPSASCPPQSHQTIGSSQQPQPILPMPSQMSNTMVNSNTLLSHLLTNSGASSSAGSYAGGGVIEKMSGAQNINFGLSKPILQLGQQQQQTHVNHQSMSMSVGPSTSGNISPPLLSNTPSPPMGPPLGGPSSPSKPFRQKGDGERVGYKSGMVQQEHRRVCHINAEQKRRCNIKNGFDTLHALIPQLNHNPNAKVSKAAMLQKGAEYIRQLKMDRAQMKEEIEAKRQEVEALNADINNCQSMLPATGAPVSRQRTNKMTEMFDQWVRIRTTENWRFWIFSILIRPLLDSYNNTVSTASVDELCRTVLAWVDQHCSLVDLRPVVLNSLRYLCTTTDILTNPANLSEEAYRSISRPSRDNSERENPR
ncbi:Carbohydrate-responsive element-binding protein [Orchesella cincta]|uniref:Carbohydrate-responsive element-binding protein n=1 Tax=Orchesella cincta TaxID=48709 RepID=A0A1D2NAU2_ORCCI|nr:Carbohydrate-responsive element-binding protein [Orchesella cincta]